MTNEIPPTGPTLPLATVQDPPRLDPLQRLLLVITQPSAAFRGLKGDRISWLLPVLVVSLLMTGSPQLLHSLYMEKQEAVMEELVDRGVLSEEQAHEARQKVSDSSGDRGAGTVLLQMLLGMATQLVFRYVLPAALLLAGVRFVMEGHARFGVVLSVMGFASVPAAIREILRTPLQMAEGSLDVYFGPAALSGTHTVGGYALSMLDLFDAWILALLVLGISTVGPISRARAAGLVIPLWLIYSLAKIGLKASPFGAAL